MKRETPSMALNGLEDKYISESAVFAPGTIQEGPERNDCMQKKRIFHLMPAAAPLPALGTAAYAARNIHSTRQREIEADLKIEENHVTSHTE